MLVVLVVLMVLEELAVFLGGIFENGISPIFFCKKFIESKKKFVGEKNPENLYDNVNNPPLV